MMPVLLRKLAVFEVYPPVMAWWPTVRTAVGSVVRPLVSRFCGGPRAAVLSANWVLPVAVPDPGGVAVVTAVKATLAPNSDGLADDDTAVVVSAGFTV